MTALDDLIEDVRARNDWTGPDLVRRADAAGYKLTTSDLTDYKKKGMRHINPDKVVALAHGLGVRPYQVALAVLADNGINVPVDARAPEDAIEHDVTLSAKARKFLRAIMAADRADA